MQYRIDKVKNSKQLNENVGVNPYIYDNPKFIEALEKAIEPSSFICSYVASAIKMLEGNKITIYGFSISENPEAKYFVEENGEDSEEGHHFAVMNSRYIIDPWVYDNFNRSVFDLQNKNDEEIVRYLYGNSDNWTNITNGAEDFKSMFPKTYNTFLNQYVR